jgi:hypothetical protein
MNIVTWRLKAGVLVPEETFIVRERFGKHVPAEKNTQVKNRGIIGNDVFCSVRAKWL